MASAAATCESPMRRFAAKETPSKSSPAEVNRLKSLLRRKINFAEDVPSSPKKAATPRKEVKVKRGATVKLCTSCETHNKDVSAKPPANNAEQQPQKQRKVADATADAAKKTRAGKKKAEPQDEGQGQNPAEGAKATVEKKAVAKKPREVKKKAVTQEEKLGAPSTSGGVQSDVEGNALTDGGAQLEGEAKPKRQRKKSEKPAQQNEPESSIGKEKSKRKEVIKVKVAAPKKKTKNTPEDNEKEPLENLDGTDLANSDHQGQGTKMQNTVEKSDDNTKSKPAKTSKVVKINSAKNPTSDTALANVGESSDKPIKSTVRKATSSKSGAKTNDITKPKVSTSKKTDKNVPEDNVSVPLNSTPQEGEVEKQPAAGKTVSGAKPTKPNKVSHVEKSTNPEFISAKADEPSDNLNGTTVAKQTAPKSKSKTKDVTSSKIPRPKKSAKNSPEDNEETPFEKMDVTDLVNSIQQAEGNAGESSSIDKSKVKKSAKAGTNKVDKNVTWHSPLTDADHQPSDNVKNNSHNGVMQDSEDMFQDDSLTSIGKRLEVMNFSSSSKTASKDKATLGNSSSDMVCNTSGRMSSKILHSALDDTLTNFNIDSNTDEMPSTEITETSSGGMINLSASTHVSHDDLEGHSMGLNISDKCSVNDPSMQSDETFCMGDLCNSTVDNLEALANVTLRTRKNKANATKSVAQENTSWADGNSFFTQKDVSDVTQKALNQTDENQQPSTANISEHSSHVKTEPSDDIHDDSTLNLPYHESSIPSGSSEINVTKNKSQKQASTSAELKSKATKKLKSPTKASKAVEPSEQKSKKVINDSVNKSLKEAPQKSTNKSKVVEPKGQKSKKNLANESSEDAPQKPADKSRDVELKGQKSKNPKKNSTNEPAKEALQKPHEKSEVVEPKGQKSKSHKKDSAKESSKEAPVKQANDSSQKESEVSTRRRKCKKNDETLCEKHKDSKKTEEKRAHRLAKEKKSNKQLKKDMKVAKAMAELGQHFSRISVGTTIGTINEVRIGRLFSDSDSSCECECSTDCSCSEYDSESTSSGGHCKCWKCRMEQRDSSSEEDESSDESESASSSEEEVHRRPARKCNAKASKSVAKPDAYVEKLSKFCSKYDLRQIANKYNLRSKD